MVTKTVSGGYLSGSGGADNLTGIAQNGAGQIHVYAKAGDDTIKLDFSGITQYSSGHHARGDGSGGVDDTSTDRGSDTFNFTNVHRVDDIIVGRIEDFSPRGNGNSDGDHLEINGNAISLSQLQSGSGKTGGYNWRIVEYDADSTDSAKGKQQWILIDTGQGFIFYALEGARVTNGDGASNSGNQEAHFLGAMNTHQVTVAELNALPTVGYVDPVNYVPAGYTAQGGATINDDDNTWADTLVTITGTGSGDLIAAGLNDDSVSAGSGNDIVWGGSGNDSINGGDDQDVIYGGTGNDRIKGGSGKDTVYGETGNDNLTGGKGDDHLYGGKGNDVLNGSDGDDRGYGGKGDDKIYGEAGNDRLYGGKGDDKLFGSTGNDSLFGQKGDDLLSGGKGRDILVGGQGTDITTGGKGADTFEFNTGDLMDWDKLSGNWTAKNNQLDKITDFEIGVDTINFDNFANVDSMADLKAWRTVIDGNVYFTVEVRDTNERILVDVDDDVTKSQFFDSDNFDFT